MSSDAHRNRLFARLTADLAHDDPQVLMAALSSLSDLLRNPVNLRPSLERGIPKALVVLLAYDHPGVRRKVTELLGMYSGESASARSIMGGDAQRLKADLLTTCSGLAIKLQASDRPEMAVTAAIEALKMGSELHGHHSLALIPLILQLASCCIDVGNLKKAETCLTQASFIVSKAGAECTSEVRSSLYRVLGRLYTAHQNAPLALQFLADDVYYSSLAYGPADVKTAGGYAQMAAVFQLSGHAHDAGKAAALLDTVERIWRGFLVTMLRDRDGETDISEADAYDAQRHLDAVIQSRAPAEPEAPWPLAFVKARGTMALLQAAVSYFVEAKEQLEDLMDLGLADDAEFVEMLGAVTELAAKQAAGAAE